MNRFLTKDFLAGLMFVGFGVLAYAVAFTDVSKLAGQSRLALGTPVRMGPGYVPQMLSFVMMGLGLIIALRAAFVPSDPIEKGQWRPILMITLGIVAFGVLLDPGNIPAMIGWFVPGIARWDNPVSGMLPAMVAMVFLAAMGGDEFKWRETAIMCVVLFVFCYVIFIWGLQMNIAILTGVW